MGNGDRFMIPSARGHGDVLDECRPYLVASSLGAASRPKTPPVELGRSSTCMVDPLRADSVTFLNSLQRLNEWVDGPARRAMPRWVFYDCGEVPGGVIGYGIPADRLSREAVEGLGVDGASKRLAPASMLMAIPMLRRGWWQIYGLGAIEQTLGDAGSSELRSRTIALAMAMLDVEVAVAVSPWRASTMEVLTRFAPLPLMTAWTPAHDDPRSATICLPDPEAVVRAAVHDTSAPDPDDDSAFWIDFEDDEVLLDLQLRLESGERWEIAGRPRTISSRVQYPVRPGTWDWPREEPS